MSDQTDVTGQDHRLIQPFVDFWSSYLQKADEATKPLLVSADVVDGSQALDFARLAAISKAMDAYLRSPEFLGAMRHGIASIVKAKKQLNGRRQTRVGDGDRDHRQMADAQIVSERAASPSSSSRQQTSAMWHRFLGLPQGPKSAGDVLASATPYKVVYQDPTLRLLRFHSDSTATRLEPVLVCFSLINRPYILDLHADRSVIRQLLAQGLDVYLIDWRVPTPADRTLRLHDYVCRRMKKAADVVCEHAHARHMNLLGYCMGGTMAAMFTSLFPSRVRNLILLAAPIDFSGEEGLLNVWTRADHFDVDALIDAFGNCPGWFLQTCFQYTRPVHNFVLKYVKLAAHSEDHAFLDNFFAVERWANDNVPIAGDTFREFIKCLYQQNQLILGKLRLNERPVELRRITCPLLILSADRDHLVPPSSTRALKDHAASTESLEMSIPAGHMGLAISSISHQQLWPDAAAWIAEHSTSL